MIVNGYILFEAKIKLFIKRMLKTAHLL